MLLCELPANAWRKFACGSWMCVWPARTAQPVTTMKRRMAILKTLRP